ncbi:DUF3472 domain-containing protein [Aestuariivivens insulae]|uniref:DUF3472 domain-containing protein n=1 Tax=Aestuariivivens insulae TaxID=1621988 RepID=UPI001F5737F1|nr:DUF3472 domain-containing protein [Aestuariivivens insulae]
MKTIKLIAFLVLTTLMVFYSCDDENVVVEQSVETQGSLAKGKPVKYNFTISVPTEGNSWVVGNPTATTNIIGTGGISNWTNSADIIRTYFYATQTGDIQLGLQAMFSSNTKLNVTLDGVTQQTTFTSSNGSFNTYSIGTFTINQTGYHYVELEGVSSNSGDFGDISDILLGDSTWDTSISFIGSSSFYFGRRGPSVHLRYTKPAGKDITWFYNEVTVPVNKDVVGSYFMVNGFGDGYFGMQVNSESQRRILFSVWSAYQTQDPSQIPAEYTVIPLGYGDGVTVGEFGGEGSGAQSYFNYDWVAGNTYKFLLKGESTQSNSTDYTAYFYAPEIGDWKLIASFRKPFPNYVHINNMHSFLENFKTEMGDQEREAYYTNQWAYDTQGVWNEMTTAKFTTDNTGNNGVRLDYDGGLDGAGGFYLRNCGFFDDNEIPNTYFTRTAGGIAPYIDFSQLEVPTLSLNLLDRTSWTIADYSSQEDNGGEGTTGRAADILDGDINTYWHSCWSGCTSVAPHHIVVDMGQSNTVDGVQFIQRQNLGRAVKDMELQISDDNVNWQSLGDYILQNITSEQNIDFSQTQTFRYLKFIAKTSHDGNHNASLAELAPYIYQ